MESCAIIIANSEDQAMQSERSRLVHDICGRPMIGWLSQALEQAGAEEQLYVVGARQEQIRRVLGENFIYVFMGEDGGGEAVLQATNFLESRGGCALILPGDAPLLTADTLKNVLDTFDREQPGVLLLTVETRLPGGQPRILRDERGAVQRLGGQNNRCGESKLREIDTGMYCFDAALLLSTLGKLTAQNGMNFNMIDIINSILEEGQKVYTYSLPQDEALTVQRRIELETARRRLNRRICHKHMLAGVTIENPDSCLIEADVQLEQDVLISPGCRLTGQTVIQSGSVLGPRTHMHNSLVGSHCRVDSGYYSDVVLADGVIVGPGAYFCDGVHIGKGSCVGRSAQFSACSIGALCQIGSRVALTLVEISDAVYMGDGVTVVTQLPPAKTNEKPLPLVYSHIGQGAQIGDLSRLYKPFELPNGARVQPGSIVQPTKKPLMPWGIKFWKPSKIMPQPNPIKQTSGQTSAAAERTKAEEKKGEKGRGERP